MARSNPRVLAAEMADEGAEEGTVLVREGASRPRLEFSVILRPGGNPRPGMLAVIATFCAMEGIRKDTGIIAWVRWPDEVVTDEKVLATTSLTTGGSTAAPWTIMNFNVRIGRTRDTLTTSLEDLLGVTVDSLMLVNKILESLAWLHWGWVRGMQAQILKHVGSTLEVAERRVAITHKGKTTAGVVRGVDERGRLIVELEESGISAHVEERSALLRF